MGVFVYLPLILPLTALPIARLAEQHLHPRTAARLLTAVAAILATCSTVCLGLLVVVGTAQLPGNPLPDSWSDPEVRAAVPYDEIAGKASIGALALVLLTCAYTLYRHYRYRSRAHRVLAGLGTASEVAVLPDDQPYAYALPGTQGRILVSTGMLAALTDTERHALLAHERAHLAGRHHRLLLAVRLAGCANPLLRPLHRVVGYCTERWADEEAARATGDRRATARAVGKAALVSRKGRGAVFPGLAAFAEPGPVPRRVAALLGPLPPANGWPPALTSAGVAALVAAAGTAASTLSALNAAVGLYVVLEAATFG
ncbi:membrane protein [Streptomyces spiroverticillatus]|uniref:Membrane protein n=1 Tax=Streptomyces finlayi TaxID=67296 RepID=A0A918WWJ6_9ACTN|nr:M56 family metallopeptidase [Streptomyces finlayi]GHA07583.1 membrane protein [Streptomyces spiroverticillatus]GHC90890.1 membrane protein [Streptomyces finlayi]